MYNIINLLYYCILLSLTGKQNKTQTHIIHLFPAHVQILLSLSPFLKMLKTQVTLIYVSFKYHYHKFGPGLADTLWCAVSPHITSTLWKTLLII